MTEDASPALPALFLGHGSPLNAVEDNDFSRAWRELAERIPRPRAVLCVSAHWETTGVRVTSGLRPETIHDFGGFPAELFAVEYPAPGDPALAARVAGLLPEVGVTPDPRRGLDHGSWSVLRAMYPAADVPVVQLSLQRGRPPRFHLELGGRLAPLRAEGVLVVGSGNIVHDLGRIDFRQADGFPWAVRFAERVKERIVARDHDSLVEYPRLGPEAALAVPTPEHYLPLLYVLGMRGEDDPVAFVTDAVVMGSISMTSIVVGNLRA